ncbi:JAB domain-containing protein [Rhodohalobacter sp. SW132]|uniref:RadC family protein n=1 Tax=Rhodohalobacter sp. SW132 TaxID=2293433 RepID=UPI000E24CD98|nr:DNA repair protein RadC [Rhodohalobacter sp. SW132]REL38454.1 JAB domain-containing protein [Rhodohalobacter sp. SW132]
MDCEQFDTDQFLNRSVKEMNPDEQPREKLAKYGADTLSDSELLAIVLRTGSRQMNVIQTSNALISHFNGLRNLARQNWQSVRVIPGIAKVKAITLEAIFELSRRIETAALGEQVKITSPRDAAAYFMPMLRDLSHEQFYVGFLNNSKILTGYRRISSGGRNSTIVEPAEVMRQAILNQANSIILAHNHPSGMMRESAADVNLTRRIADVGKKMGVPVDDHIIIAGDSFVSFRNKGLL